MTADDGGPLPSGDAPPGEGGYAWAIARGLFNLVVPVFAEQQPFGPRPLSEVAIHLAVATGGCAAAGYWLTRTDVLLRLAASLTDELREEVWDERRPPPDEASSSSHSSNSVAPDAENGAKPVRRHSPKRTPGELLFIGVHNSTVATLAALAWLCGSQSLALFAFTLEVAYEIFDTFSLGLKRLEPETLIHHIVSPICILCSTQTDVDYRVLCHLCVCIDLSGAVLGVSKFMLRFSHWSSVQIYRNLQWVYLALRVILPFIDTAIIVRKSLLARGGYFSMVTVVEVYSHDGSEANGFNGHPLFAKTDSTQLYFWAMAVLDAFNLYFFYVIRARARMSPQQVQYLERTGCH